MDVQANSSLDKLYTNSIFVDDYSDIETIHYQDGKRKRKIKFKLSDYEIDGIFHSDAKVCYFDHKFEREGQVVTFTYKKTIYDLKFLNKVFFSDVYEIENSVINIRIPNWMDAKVIKWNFDDQEIESELKKNKEFTLYLSLIHI